MNGDNGQKDKRIISHLGNVVPPQFEKTMWKPGQSGNPTGGTKRRRGLVDHLREFFGETVTAKDSDGKPVTMKREKYLARMIGEAAMSSKQPGVRMECMKICIEQLWPVPKQPIVFVAANPTFHDQRTINLIGMLEQRADGGEITPNMVLDLLEADARGELEPVTTVIEGDDDEPQDKL